MRTPACTILNSRRCPQLSRRSPKNCWSRKPRAIALAPTRGLRSMARCLMNSGIYWRKQMIFRWTSTLHSISILSSTNCFRCGENFSSCSLSRNLPLQNRLDFRIDGDMGLLKSVDDDWRVRACGGRIAKVKEPADVVILVEKIKNALGLIRRYAHRRDGHELSKPSRRREIFFHYFWQAHGHIQTYAPDSPYGTFI